MRGPMLRAQPKGTTMSARCSITLSDAYYDRVCKLAEEELRSVTKQVELLIREALDERDAEKRGK